MKRKFFLLSCLANRSLTGQHPDHRQMTRSQVHHHNNWQAYQTTTTHQGHTRALNTRDTSVEPQATAQLRYCHKMKQLTRKTLHCFTMNAGCKAHNKRRDCNQCMTAISAWLQSVHDCNQCRTYRTQRPLTSASIFSMWYDIWRHIVYLYFVH